MVLIKTNGIILKTYPYGDSGLIVKIYTESEGLLSFLAIGARKAKGKSGNVSFMPLQEMELVYYKKDDHQLQKIKEMNVVNHPHAIYTHPVKLSVLIFLSEIIYKSLHEHVRDLSMYKYITLQMKSLEETEEISLFPHHFLAGFFKWIGIQPKLNYSDTNKFFNKEEGLFQSIEPMNRSGIQFPMSEYFYILNRSVEEPEFKLSINYQERLDLLTEMIHYLKIHVLHSKNILSPEILHTIL